MRLRVAHVVWAAGAAWAVTAQAVSYVVEPLGFLPGGSFSRARGVSASGVVVGEATLPGFPPVERAVGGGGGGLAELATPGFGARSRALDTSPAGTVVGWVDAGPGVTVPYVWAGGSGGSLPLGGGAVAGTAWGASDGGVIVGQQVFADGSTAAAWWDGGGWGVLAGLGGTAAIAYSVNAAGTIGGSAGAVDGEARAVVWDGGGAVDVGGVGGGQWSAVRRLNAAGAMILWGIPVGSTAAEATLWSGVAGEAPESLGTFGGVESWAYGLNNLGQVVGSADREDGTYGAFYWSGSGDLEPLAGLGGLFSAALAINDAGVIVGWAMDGANRTQAVRWVPVPEPAVTGVLVALVAVVVSAVARAVRPARRRVVGCGGGGWGARSEA